jgi:hypothetical protein
MAESGNPFSPRTVAAVVLAGVVAFLGFLFLTAYAPQFNARSGSGAQPLSKSAVGFHALYTLAGTTGRLTQLADDESRWAVRGFMIVTIDADTDVARLKRLVATRRATDATKTLYIMPKWLTVPMRTRRGWVQGAGTLPAMWSPAIIEVFGRIGFGEGVTVKGGRVRGIADGEMAGIDVAAPPRPRFIALGMKPVLVDSNGRIVLGRTDLNNGSADYILADPDLLSNQGLKTVAGARAALTLVDALRSDTDDSVEFDMVLNGMGGTRNLLQLMFEPPFLALTLAVLAAALLVGIHAFGRFGPARAEPRAIPFGKRALADNAAMLIARAGAARRMGDRYVALIRERVAGALGAQAMDAEAQERWLGALPGVRGADFTRLAADARAATDSESMRAAARALYDWRNEVTRDR